MRRKWLLVLVALVFLVSGCAQKPPPAKPMSLVSAQGTDFMIGGKPLRFVGAFTFPTMTQFLYEKWRLPNYKKNIDQYFESLPPNVNVIRVFTFGPYIQNFHGFKEPNWQTLDYMVKSAEAHGVYIIWVLYDCWDYSPTGVLPNYNYEFWRDNGARQIILAQVARYSNSPAIFAWELINEGDTQAKDDTEREEILRWVDDVSSAIRAIDSNHLISTGFSNEDLRELKFKYPDAYPTRRDWILRVHDLTNIDFVTFHAYGGPPDLQTDASFFTDRFRSEVSWYFDEMTRVRSDLGKPIIAEEFGTQRQVGEPVRRQVYELYFGQLLVHKISGLFNLWADDKTPQSCSIYTYDEEYGTIKDAAARIKN